MGAGAPGVCAVAPAGLSAAEVVSVARLGAYARLTVEVAGWQAAQPGQFVMLHAEGSPRLLARPFSISNQEVRSGGALLTFLVDPVGPASREAAGLRPRGRVSLLGPLGRGFSLDEMLAPEPLRGAGGGSCPAAVAGSARRRLVVVSGGVGMAPFPLLLRSLAQRIAPGLPPTAGSPPPAAVLPPVLLCGFRDALQAGALTAMQEAAEELRCAGLGSGLLHATDDGGSGVRGPVTDLLRRELQTGDSVAACGPPAMCRAVWEVCRAVPGVRCWFSLEARMACGVGSCHGCVIQVADGTLARVCRRGPVFSGQEAFGEVHHAVSA